MITFKHYKDIEKKLQQAAELMPETIKPLPLSPVMEKRKQAGKKYSSHRWWTNLWHASVWKLAVIALFVVMVGSTTIFAASPRLRTAIVHFFSSGITETVPSADLKESVPATDSSSPTNDVSGELSGDMTRQTVGSLTLLQDITLDSHFTASYASSSDYLTLVETPSGTPLFLTQTEDGKTAYYGVTDGNLEEIVLKTHTLTATVQPGTLPGIMTYGGNTKSYHNLSLPAMELTVKWQQYGSDVLIDDTKPEHRFDIGSSYGFNSRNVYDGQFICQAMEGKEDIIEVLFLLDAQQTGYQYPFLLDLTTGEVSDPLALVDLSDWTCIENLSIEADLVTAKARAGSSHEDLQEITIDLNTGIVTEETSSAKKLPTDDCLIQFPVGNDIIFYVTGTEESGDGYLYNTQTGESTVVFTDTTDYSFWGSNNSSTRYWDSIGYGYLVYYANDTVSLINLKDGGTSTILEGIPMSQSINFFVNNEGTVLSISSLVEKKDSFNTARLCLMDLKTMKAWYFDRNLPEDVEEVSHYWNGEYGYVIEAEDTENGTNYIYMYQYTP